GRGGGSCPLCLRSLPAVPGTADAGGSLAALGVRYRRVPPDFDAGRYAGGFPAQPVLPHSAQPASNRPADGSAQAAVRSLGPAETAGASRRRRGLLGWAGQTPAGSAKAVSASWACDFVARGCIDRQTG